jgi:hypothetical protein
MSAQAAADAILAAARELKQLLGSRANDTVAVREHHSHGESYHTPAAPDIVCFPQTTAEVAAIVKIAARHRLAIVPFGAGTSLEGHVNAIRGGVTIDLREMNKVSRVSVEDLDVTVEAGKLIGADHLATWASNAVVVVSSGQSSAERIHSVGEMIRLAGMRLELEGER